MTVQAEHDSTVTVPATWRSKIGRWIVGHPVAFWLSLVFTLTVLVAILTGNPTVGRVGGWIFGILLIGALIGRRRPPKEK